MRTKGWMFYAAMTIAVIGGGLLGGFNYHWTHLAKFPVYGIAIDILAVPVLLGLILFVRRLKRAQTDEFSITKKRIAAQVGMAVGMIAFLLINAVPVFIPHAYHAFLAGMDGAEDGYIIGRVVGMAPFAIGLAIGQIVTWARYR